MQKTNVWNLLAIHSGKVIICLLLLNSLHMSAQFTVKEYENRYSLKPYHFGITLAYNTSHFKINYHDDFLHSDSILVAEGINGPGFNLGIISNLRLDKHFDLRFIPSLSFAEKSIDYILFDESVKKQSIESIYFEFPLDMKFKSDSYRDMKIYLMGGMKYSYDLSSNAKARNAEDIVKVSAHDVSIDYGFGFEFYFPYFIFSPELKLSNGIFDLHSRDPNLIYSRSIDKLFSRTILISIHLEG